MRVTPSEVHAVSLVRSEPSTDFRFPDWNAPLDLPERLQRTPPEQTIKGMFIQQILERARAASGTVPSLDGLLSRGPAQRDYAAFDNYSMREWIELLVLCAELAYPTEPVREGIRRLGHLSYGTFAASSAGRALRGVIDESVTDLLRSVPRYYRVTGRGGIADVSFLAERRAIVHLRDSWDFPDAYHVGAYEGAIRALGAEVQVKVRAVGLAGADLEIIWW